MSHIIIGLHHHADDFISEAVSWFTHGRYSHAVLVSPCHSRVVESSGARKPQGVLSIPFEAWAISHPAYVLRKIPHPDPAAVWDQANTQVGKEYDWHYLWGWLARRNWQDPEKWVCHELIPWACQQAGHPVIEMDNAHWLTPDHLYRISQPLE
jgi:uncharacterized protein YycO